MKGNTPDRMLQLPSQEDLQYLLDYDPVSGRLTRLSTRRLAGSRAGQVRLHGGKLYRTVRVIWRIFYGEDPGELWIDHRDRDHTNNRIGNLRLATVSQNARNARVRSDTKSGMTGVIWRAGRWHAYISIEGQLTELGKFDDKQQAIDARVSFERAYHGEFSKNATGNYPRPTRDGKNHDFAGDRG